MTCIYYPLKKLKKREKKVKHQNVMKEVEEEWGAGTYVEVSQTRRPKTGALTAKPTRLLLVGSPRFLRSLFF